MQLQHSRSYIITFKVNIFANFTYIVTLNTLSHKSLSARNRINTRIWYYLHHVHDSYIWAIKHTRLQMIIYSGYGHDIQIRIYAD